MRGADYICSWYEEVYLILHVKQCKLSPSLSQRQTNRIAYLPIKSNGRVPSQLNRPLCSRQEWPYPSKPTANSGEGDRIDSMTASNPLDLGIFTRVDNFAYRRRVGMMADGSGCSVELPSGRVFREQIHVHSQMRKGKVEGLSKSMAVMLRPADNVEDVGRLAQPLDRGRCQAPLADLLAQPGFVPRRWLSRQT